MVRVLPGSESESQERISQSEVDTKANKLADDGSPHARAQRYGILECRTIPWTDGARETQDSVANMTGYLALWWLHIMAAEDKAIENVYSPLRKLSRDSVNKDIQYPPTPESAKTTPSAGPHGKRLQTSRNLSVRPRNKAILERNDLRKRARDKCLDLEEGIGPSKRSRD